MKNARYLVLFSLILISCRTPSTGDIARFNNRPDVKDPCIANGDGTCFRNGVIFPTENMFCGDANDYFDMNNYIDFLEKYRYYCKKFNRCD